MVSEQNQLWPNTANTMSSGATEAISAFDITAAAAPATKTSNQLFAHDSPFLLITTHSLSGLSLWRCL